MERVDYGVDAPGVVRGLITGGVVALACGMLLSPNGPLALLRPAGWAAGICLVLTGLFMLLYSKVAKFHYRDKMLERAGLRGDERILDVGAGRGLLLIGAAKRLSSGRAVGIDIWSAKDLSSNSPDATLANAQGEGVRDRVEVRSMDATEMGFDDGEFDVVLSNLCLHNIPSAEGRLKACREIARVLKPGGRALISDFLYTRDYQRAFSEAGLQAERTPPYLWTFFPPLRIVIAVKPAA